MWNTQRNIYIYSHVLIDFFVLSQLFSAAPEMLQASIETQLILRQSDILRLTYHQ